MSNPTCPHPTRLSQLVCFVLLVLLCTVQTSVAQTTLTPAKGEVQANAASPTELHIDILEGEGALNNIRERNAREPIVQVEDENHRPVAGALVLFTLHNGASGAGGTLNGLSTFSVTTGVDGRAQLRGLELNQAAGSFSITVTASLGAVTAEAIIHESNVSGPAQASTSTETTGSILRKHSVKRNLLFLGGAVVVVSLIVGLSRQHGTTITAGAGSVRP